MKKIVFSLSLVVVLACAVFSATTAKASTKNVAPSCPGSGQTCAYGSDGTVYVKCALC